MGRRRSAVTADERIAVAVLWCGNRLLLQLRDFRAGISDPGEWGFFGGHLKDEEAPDEGLRRELLEDGVGAGGAAPPRLVQGPRRTIHDHRLQRTKRGFDRRFGAS